MKRLNNFTLRRSGLWSAVVSSVLVLLACGGGGGETPASTAPPASLSASERMIAELPPNTKCPGADNTTLVYAGVECLVVKTFGTPAPSGDKLVVFLHGDVSAGGPADYMDTYAPNYVQAGITTVRMLRPGYYDKLGNTSTGGNGDNRADTYTTNNVQAVAYALAALRQHHQASKLVVVGHSGGASIAATVLGKYPGVIDNVALLACPCDLRAWRKDWVNSLSAMDWVAGVPSSSKVIGMTGTADTQVPAVFSQTYVNALSSRGILTQQIAIPGATHSASTLFTTTQVQTEIQGLIQ
jgi:pimeloyl-ACP methyl ester carboxylesterase